MNNNERIIIGAILIAIAAFIGVDLLTDASQGAAWWHLAFELAIAIGALVGVFLLLLGALRLREDLTIANCSIREHKAEAAIWRDKAKTYIEGLSQAIAAQLSDWKLTSSETEIAFMLLKGLSLKEIAAIRGTNEKTTRAQATSIYQKSGLSGRADLAAFFLEDLLG
jgi:DNA-binding CsgD family transcriptional regulator